MSKEAKRDIHVVEFSNYNRPEPVEVEFKGWVLNGPKNEQYQYIIDRIAGSPTNSSILNSYKTLMYGKGLSIHGHDEGSKELDGFLEICSKKDQKAILSDYADFGAICMQIHRQKGNLKELASIKHLEKNLVVPEIKDENGDITGYYFCSDWSKEGQSGYEATRYPAFGYGDGSEPEIYVGRPYQAGQEYFENPDYQAALVYAELEEEISNYYISHAKNGLSFGTVINVPDSDQWSDERKKEYKKAVLGATTGSSNAGVTIMSFNGRDTEPITVDNIENNQAHKQWDFLTQEARQQLITAHRVTSPMLVGVSVANGFSSTSEEMDAMETQLMKRIIQPKQDFVLDAYEEIMNYFKKDFEDFYYRPLTEIEGEKEEETKAIAEGVEMSAMCDCDKKKDEFEFLESMAEYEPLGFELHSIDYDVENEIQFASTANSVQDSDKWKIRYAYNIGTSKTPLGGSRSFCNKMMSLANQGKVFRVEDIDKMSADGVNGQFAHENGKYDIFLYAGGVNCYHRWERRIYKKKTQENGKLYGGNATQNTTQVNVSEARRQGAKIPKNAADVAIAEIDKPSRGSLK